jgi:hypothetical protein
MLFKIEKGWNDHKPFEEFSKTPKLKQADVYRVQQRTVNDPQKLTHNKYDRENWYKEGENHRIIDGEITRDRKEKAWVMDCTIEDIKELTKAFGEIRIENWDNQYKQLNGEDLPIIRICS